MAPGRAPWKIVSGAPDNETLMRRFQDRQKKKSLLSPFSLMVMAFYMQLIVNAQSVSAKPFDRHLNATFIRLGEQKLGM